MVFTESLGREISGYIKSLLNANVFMLDEQMSVISSFDNSMIGQKIKLLPNVSELTTHKIVKVDNLDKIVIPLRHNAKNVAYIIVDNTSKEANNFLPLIKSFAELLIQQYSELNKPNLDSTDLLITKILKSYSPSDVIDFESRGKVLGYDFLKNRIAIMVHLKGFWNNCLLDFDQPSFERDQVIANWKKNIESKLNSFFTKNSDLITAYIGDDRFVIFKAVEKGSESAVIGLLKKSYKSIFESLKNHRIDSVTVGFSNSYSGVEGLLNACREAGLSLELGQKIKGENQSYYFEDLGLLSILGDGDREKKISFATQILNRLKNDDLKKTLECFFDNNLNLTETADQMGIHRNTVIYRLNQITRMLNADPRIFEQAMSIKIALIIKTLFGK